MNASALRLAVVIRAELLEVMQRIELPVSPPAFGCQDNSTNIKRALISGFFLKVNAHAHGERRSRMLDSDWLTDVLEQDSSFLVLESHCRL